MKNGHLSTLGTLLEVANLEKRYGLSKEKMASAFWNNSEIKRLSESLGVSSLAGWRNYVYFWNQKEVPDFITQTKNIIERLFEGADETPAIYINQAVIFRKIAGRAGRDRDARLVKENKSREINRIFEELLKHLDNLKLWKIGKCAGCLFYFSRDKKKTKYCSECSDKAAQKKFHEKNKEKRNKDRSFRRSIKNKYTPWIIGWKERKKNDEQILNSLRNLLKDDGLSLQENTLKRWIKEAKVK